MTTYDGIMLGLIVAGMVWGAMKGITWQVAGLASLVLGYLVAFPAAGPLTKQIPFPGNESVQWGLALATAYVAVSGGVFLAAWSVRTTLRRMKFEAYDRHLGMILGGVEAALVGVIATVMIVSVAPSTREPIRSSHAGHAVSRTLAFAQAALPAKARDALKPFWEAAEKDGLVADADADGDGDGPGLVIGRADEDDDRPRRPRSADAEPPAEDAPDLIDDVLKEGKARVGRAVREAIEDQLDPQDDAPAAPARARNPRRR